MLCYDSYDIAILSLRLRTETSWISEQFLGHVRKSRTSGVKHLMLRLSHIGTT